jgi:hypothetical protein
VAAGHKDMGGNSIYFKGKKDNDKTDEDLEKGKSSFCELVRISRRIIKVKPCFSDPKRGGNGLNPRKGEGLA